MLRGPFTDFFQHKIYGTLKYWFHGFAIVHTKKCRTGFSLFQIFIADVHFAILSKVWFFISNISSA